MGIIPGILLTYIGRIAIIKYMMHLTLLVPAYNEQSVLPLFLESTLPVVQSLKGVKTSFLFINDGSTDGTLNLLKRWAAQYSFVQVISLARNFGKEAAVTAGLQQASRADAVIIMDSDLQDPPSLIPQFIEKFNAGFDSVYGVRTNRQADTWVKRTTAHAFYKIYNFLSDRNMPPNAGDCRLLSRRAVQALLQLPERERFLKGMFNWIGFKSAAVEFTRSARRAGHTKWNYWKLWNFALQGLTASSTSLLRLWAYVGTSVSCVSVLYAVWVAFKKIVYGNPVSGYTSLMVAILFFSGVQLLSLGILGEYVSRIFIEVKQRPLYIIDEKINC